MSASTQRRPGEGLLSNPLVSRALDDAGPRLAPVLPRKKPIPRLETGAAGFQRRCAVDAGEREKSKNQHSRHSGDGKNRGEQCESWPPIANSGDIDRNKSFTRRKRQEREETNNRRCVRMSARCSLLLVFVRMLVLVLVPVSPEPMQMRMGVSGELPVNVGQPKKQKRAAGDAREPNPDAITQRDPEPGHDQTERRGEEHMPAARERGDPERLHPTPTLRAGGQDKGEPVRRNGRMKKRDPEAGDRDRRENGIVHLRRDKSGCRDLNPGPPAPETGALPS